MPLGVHDECAGVRDAERPAGRFRIQDAEALDHCGPFVRQERKRDATCRGKRLQGRRWIVADRCQPDAALLEIGCTLLQLHQLRLAVGSPISRSEEHEHRAVRSEHGLQRLRAAVLIDQGEIWNARANLRAQLVEFGGRARWRRLWAPASGPSGQQCAEQEAHTSNASRCRAARGWGPRAQTRAGPAYAKASAWQASLSCESRDGRLLASRDLIPDCSTAAADGRADQRALLAANRRADAGADTSRRSDDDRALLHRARLLHRCATLFIDDLPRRHRPRCDWHDARIAEIGIGRRRGTHRHERLAAIAPQPVPPAAHRRPASSRADRPPRIRPATPWRRSRRPAARGFADAARTSPRPARQPGWR